MIKKALALSFFLLIVAIVLAVALIIIAEDEDESEQAAAAATRSQPPLQTAYTRGAFPSDSLIGSPSPAATNAGEVPVTRGATTEPQTDALAGHGTAAAASIGGNTGLPAVPA